MPMQGAASMVARSTSFASPVLCSLGRFCMMVDKGVDARRENASWFTTWLVTAGSTSMDGAGVSSLEMGVVDAARGGHDGVSSRDSLMIAAGRAEGLGSTARFLMGDDGMQGVSAALNVSLEEAWCGRRWACRVLGTLGDLVDTEASLPVMLAPKGPKE